MPGEPPAWPALGGGSGALCTDAVCCGCATEPVTSLEGTGARLLNGLDSNRWMSELQATAVTESEANRAKRNTASQRRGSATQPIGVPTHTRNNTGGQLNAGR